MNADVAYKLACEGTALLWQGDFQNARQLLQALARRIDKGATKKKSTKAIKKNAEIISPRDTFHLHRQAQLQRTRILSMVLIPFEENYTIPLRRAPDVSQACCEAYGEFKAPFAASLRELSGIIGAHEWHKNGVMIPALGEKIHPRYGVFSPIRGEYLDLLAKAPLPSNELAFDIGTGTGVIAALLAKRGVKKIVATDQDLRALECAAENLQRLGLSEQIDLQKTDLFPSGKAPLIVCNPPWIPARPSSAIEYAIYDPDSRMLREFLAGAAAHLEENGEAWLIISDIAEHLGLRSNAELWSWIEAGGLQVIGKMDIKPQHAKASDDTDPLHAARALEVTSLWRLKHIK
jgi:methylase of polypeptide subunit release factors